MGLIKKIIKYLFNKTGYTIRKANIPFNFWETDKTFTELFTIIKNHSLVSADRCFMIYQYAKHCKGLTGDIAQVGVYKGGSAKLIAEEYKNTNKFFHLFDTFSGMPETDKQLDLHREGDFKDVTLKEVKNYLAEYNNLEFYKGYFPATARDLGDKQFCFVYLDVDIYQSVKDGFKFFYPRLVSGGVIIIDDYEGKHCPGVKYAIDEYIKDKDNISVIKTTKAQCILIKK